LKTLKFWSGLEHSQELGHLLLAPNEFHEDLDLSSRQGYLGCCYCNFLSTNLSFLLFENLISLQIFISIIKALLLHALKAALSLLLKMRLLQSSFLFG